MITRAVAAIGLCAAVACTGTYPAPKSATQPIANTGPKVGIAAAGLPYAIIDARTGRAVDKATFWAAIAKTRAVCVGEEHPNPHHHWVQLEVVEHEKTRPGLALGMEMVQRPFQGVLDDYAAGHIDAAALRSRVGWEDRWGYDYALYGPTIDAVVGAHGQLLALNAPKELTKKIAHHGLESLTPDEKTQVPELDLQNAAHRAWFNALMEEMGGGAAHSGSAASDPNAPHATPEHAEGEGSAAPPASDDMPTEDRIYTVQVVWDETMADTAAKWLKANPSGHLVILAGNGHCHDSGIVGRMKRRGITDVISVRSVIDDGQGSVAEILAKPMNDYVIVLAMPHDAQGTTASASAF
jgi:uncharacterized iron-regulated protein|nr:ChaN family lipoprotein [Kofleriaceae bacterium]